MLGQRVIQADDGKGAEEPEHPVLAFTLVYGPILGTLTHGILMWVKGAASRPHEMLVHAGPVQPE